MDDTDPAQGPVAGSDPLPDSRLYTFLDGPSEYALYFLEGQRLIQDLALIHAIGRSGFAYFRDVVLSIQPMIALLKHGEQFGFYIDSEEPFFRLKIETAHHGATRCMLLPEDFHEFPRAMRGEVRVHKLFPGNKLPYQSVLEIDGLPLREIVNRVLDESYQVNCAVMVSPASDQSLLLHQLPPLPSAEDYDFSPEAARGQREQIREALDRLFGRALHSKDEIETAFREIGFRLLADRPVQFQCSCSRPNTIQNLLPIYAQEGDALFDPGQEVLKITCEYCKSRCEISRRELQQASNSIH